MLAGAALAGLGCASIGAVRLQGAYLIGAGQEQREIRASAEFTLREPKRLAGDGKSVAMSPAEPDCAGGGR